VIIVPGAEQRSLRQVLVDHMQAQNPI
jgi:hypothetical protein